MPGIPFLRPVPVFALFCACLSLSACVPVRSCAVNGAPTLKTAPGKLVIAGMGEELELRLVPATENTDRHNTYAVIFDAVRERRITLTYGGSDACEPLENLVVGDITVAGGATVYLRVKNAPDSNLFHLRYLWLEPGSALVIEGVGNRVLPWAGLVTGKKDVAPEEEQAGETMEARLVLDGGSLTVTDGQLLLLYANEARAAEGAPCLRVEGRGGKLVLSEESVTLSLPPSLAARIEAGKSLPLVAGDFTAEFYRTPRACSVDGKTFEIYLDDASGTPTLYARLLKD